MFLVEQKLVRLEPGMTVNIQIAVIVAKPTCPQVIDGRPPTSQSFSLI